MKKIWKILAVAAMVVCCSCALAIAACSGEKTYTGEYSYANPYSADAPKYGVKVEVTVDGDKIKEVKIVDSNYTVVTDSWENKATWNNNVDKLLKAYEGKTVKEVKDAKVEKQENGTPTSVSDDKLLIEGATQGSGRLLLAVQNALKDVK